jgi:hypothetical protein
MKKKRKRKRKRKEKKEENCVVVVHKTHAIDYCVDSGDEMNTQGTAQIQPTWV